VLIRTGLHTRDDSVLHKTPEQPGPQQNKTLTCEPLTRHPPTVCNTAPSLFHTTRSFVATSPASTNALSVQVRCDPQSSFLFAAPPRTAHPFPHLLRPNLSK
jgi:hypothetical protein